MWEKTPRLPYHEDVIAIYEACEKGDEALFYKERQIGLTWDIAKCVIHDMLSKCTLTAFWQSITEDHAVDVINRTKGVLQHFRFKLPPEFLQITSYNWKINIAPNEAAGIEGISNEFTAFSKSPYNITGKTADVLVADEPTKYDPPSTYEKFKREAKAATRSAKFIKIATTLHGNSFEDEVKSPPIAGPSYDAHLSGFKIPTHEEWLKAKFELSQESLNVETNSKKSKGTATKNK